MSALEEIEGNPATLQCFRELWSGYAKRTDATVSVVSSDSYIDGVRNSKVVSGLLEYLARCEFGVVAETILDNVNTSVTIDPTNGGLSLNKGLSGSYLRTTGIDYAVQFKIEMDCPLYGAGESALGKNVTVNPIEFTCRAVGVVGPFGSVGIKELDSYSVSVGLRLGTPTIRPCSVEYGAGVEVLEVLRSGARQRTP